MLKYRNKLTTATGDTRPFQLKKESARLNQSINKDSELLRTPSANSIAKHGQVGNNWSQWQQMSKNEVNLQAIKGSENRYSQVTTSLRKPLQVNAQSTTLLIQNLSQSKKLLGTKQSELGALFVANTDQDKLVRITD